VLTRQSHSISRALFRLSGALRRAPADGPSAR
jgi:hypothetical protein